MQHAFASALFVVCMSIQAFAQAGSLVIVGGGDTGPEIIVRTLELAGGNQAIVAVLPQSSAEPDAGDASVHMWREAGAQEAAKVSFADRGRATVAMRRATLIWMPGGDQNRFMKAIDGTGLADVIRERYLAGATVGGTSAGAAIMSDAMITGDADLQSITSGKTALAKGLGLWPNVIVDQHFVKRQRNNRLLSAVLDRRTLVGVGIDEATAVVVHDGAFEVVGKSSVVVIDPRGARIDASSEGQPASGAGLKLSVLRSGESYSLK
jgi:cyanophycinase